MDNTAQTKLFDALRAVDTPTICNALEEARGFRTAAGFTTQHMHPTEPDAPPMVGFARTGIIRAAQPAVGSAAEKKARRVGWYEYVVSGEGPTVAVIQDLDSNPGTGAMWGEVNSTVHRGLGVLGCVTNGSVRDLTVLAKGFPILAGKVGPSHAHVHIEGWAMPVDIFGMTVVHGDLIHADRHGAVVIPHELAAKLPAAIDLLTRKEKVILDAARKKGFGIEVLRQAFAASEDIH
ncbi:MAG TPA: RraA family protein [Reyranella sp.]|nr:RraA family protein [Reyranella sp.]